ncbi:MAG: ribosome assembly RNA-binding protein YhbY [Clostridiales bacterium]|nr:ribosome assembly RNA-binding protein YhbY [Clostridiales bacterium]
MITTKQRAFLRSMANGLDPVMQIGKEGITDGTIKTANDLFEAREIFKINVLKNCDLTAREVAGELAKLTNCEIVQCIGYKVTLYKRSSKKDIKHIVLPK